MDTFNVKKQMKLYGLSFVIMLFLAIGFLPQKLFAYTIYNANECSSELLYMVDSTHVHLPDLQECFSETGTGVGYNYINSYSPAEYPSETNEITGWPTVMYMNSGSANYDLETNNVGDGSYWSKADIYNPLDGDWVFIEFCRDGGVWFLGNCSGQTPPNTSTRFISVEPASGDTVATTTDISWSVYINSDEYTEGSYVRAYFYQDAMRSCQNSGAVYDAIFGDCPTLGDPFTIHFDDVLDRLLAGNNSTTTSYTFPQGGKWRGEYSVRVPHLFGLYYTEQIATTTLFIIGQKSTIDITRETIEAMDRPSAFSDIYASSTAQIGSTCNPLSGNFSIGDCLLDLIYDPVGFSDNLLILRQTPPWGYAFRMYDIFSTTTVGSLPVINATLPMLGNPNITVDLTNSFDFILDATTSQFANVSASSTQTFFQITNFYWSLILYVGAGFYVLSRILGTRLIPKFL